MCSFATAQHAIAQAFTKKQCLQEFSGHLSFSFSTASMGTEAQNRGPQVPIEIQKVLSIHCIQAQAICLSRPCSCLLSYLMLSLPSLPPSLPPALPPWGSLPPSSFLSSFPVCPSLTLQLFKCLIQVISRGCHSPYLREAMDISATVDYIKSHHCFRVFH